MINRVIREGLEGLVLKDVKVRWWQPLPEALVLNPSIPGQELEQQPRAGWGAEQGTAGGHK